MTDKLELKSCHEVIDTVSVADVDSIFYGKPIDPDILTVVMKDGKRLYCDEVCPINSLQEEPIILTEEILKKNGFRLNPRPRYNPPYWSKLFTASDGREYLCKINMEQKIREILMTVIPLASNEPSQPTCLLPHPKTIQQLEKSLRLFNIKYIIEV